MALAKGDKLGPYEILDLIGKGGMGEVYGAHDPRTDRDVAIKTSAAQFSERFSREVRAIAALNHPNICHLYDVGTSPDAPGYLVMELVEGQTLAERIQEGAIPLEDALQLARQVADALEAAHEKGITHRDLKPGNIKITPEGTVKVLDFGLAKVGPRSASGGEHNPEESPTISMAATEAGVILGTPAYMAPEQARGKPVDKRADIWAFGVVLYEMLAARRLFTGETAVETMAAVMKETPDLTRLPAGTPSVVRRLIARCLERDPKRRLRDIGEARILLENVPADEVPTGGSAASKPWGSWITAGVAMVALAALAFVHFNEAASPSPLWNVSIVPPDDTAYYGYVALSPDGQRVAFGAKVGSSVRLYVRDLDSPEFREVPGADGVRRPFWSPDSRSIAFWADRQLKVVPADGGPVRTLCRDVTQDGGGTWNSDGVILFSDGSSSLFGRIRRVRESGGDCAPLEMDGLSLRGSYPVFLPDGKHFIFTGAGLDLSPAAMQERAAAGRASPSGIWLSSLDDLTPRLLLDDRGEAIYSPSGADGGPAHLLLRRGKALVAQPFDEATLQVIGDPFTVVNGVGEGASLGGMTASVAANGTLVYSSDQEETQLTWFDRSGRILGTVGSAGRLVGVALASDGNHAASMERGVGIRIHDLKRTEATNIVKTAGDVGPLFSPDNTAIAYVGGPAAIMHTSLDGSGTPSVLWPPEAVEFIRYMEQEQALRAKSKGKGPSAPPPARPRRAGYVSDWAQDYIVYTPLFPATNNDIWYIPDPTGVSPQAAPFLATPNNESQGKLSPRGRLRQRWIAFSSEENLKSDVLVRRFPQGTGGGIVSTDGGQEPTWSRDGSGIYYRSGARLYFVPVEETADGNLSIGDPQRLFDYLGSRIVIGGNLYSYAPAADGQRFLISALTDQGGVRLHMISDWRRLVREGRR